MCNILPSSIGNKHCIVFGCFWVIEKTNQKDNFITSLIIEFWWSLKQEYFFGTVLLNSHFKNLRRNINKYWKYLFLQKLSFNGTFLNWMSKLFYSTFNLLLLHIYFTFYSTELFFNLEYHTKKVFVITSFSSSCLSNVLIFASFFVLALFAFPTSSSFSFSKRLRCFSSLVINWSLSAIWLSMKLVVFSQFACFDLISVNSSLAWDNAVSRWDKYVSRVSNC